MFADAILQDVGQRTEPQWGCAADEQAQLGLCTPLLRDVLLCFPRSSGNAQKWCCCEGQNEFQAYFERKRGQGWNFIFF